MAWKIDRREFVRKRPDWMIAFLMKLGPEFYEIQSSREEACRLLEQIKERLDKTGVVDRRSRLVLKYGEGELSIVNPKDHPFIRFRVIDCK